MNDNVTNKDIFDVLFPDEYTELAVADDDDLENLDPDDLERKTKPYFILCDQWKKPTYSDSKTVQLENLSTVGAACQPWGPLGPSVGGKAAAGGAGRNGAVRCSKRPALAKPSAGEVKVPRMLVWRWWRKQEAYVEPGGTICKCWW